MNLPQVPACETGKTMFHWKIADSYNVVPPFDSQVGAHNSNNYGLWYANNYSYGGL